MTSKDLHTLIKSLTSSEKGYIKKHSAIHVIGDQNKYIKIFDAIDKQKEYDEKEIIKRFTDDPILNNFSVAKNYLFRFILKCLESYHSNTKAELRSTLNQIEILHNKNLPSVAKKMLSKAKSTAQHYELYEFMEEIIDWEIVFIVEEANSKNYLDLVNKYFGELNESIEKKKTIIGYKHLYQKMRAKALYMGLPRNDEDVIAFQAIAELANSNDPSLLSTFNAQFYRNLMQANFLFVSNEQKKANALMETNVRLMEENPHMIELKPATYLGMLRNKAVNELSLMRYKPLFDTIQKMDAFVEKYGQLNRYFEVLSENLKLFVYIPTGQFNEALAIAEKLDQMYKQLPSSKTLSKERLLQHYAFTYIYIGLNDYKMANHHINILLNNHEFDVRSDMFCFAHILSLIIHFELENTELLDYRARSTYNLLLKRNQLHDFEKQIIVFLKSTKNMTRKSPEIRQAFIKLKGNIERITENNKLEKNALSLFDLISWLESKIEKKSFMQIKQEKFNRLMSPEAANAHMH
ncbi:MAG: hypothetical protein K0Q95_2057 [Bacteroidota bacterium]|jgi:hypothetical protein|nr:hypothetical protein [Bacteroidota bacterium]